MIYVLLLLPILIVPPLFWLLKQNGKHRLLNLDVVQFIHSFVLVPVFYIWVKSFLFLLLIPEVAARTLSVNQLFIIDSGFSLLFLFLSSFVVIHSLTKSFELEYKKDPLVDLFELSEYFHQTFSHFAIYCGILMVVAALSVLNLFLPFTAVRFGGFYLAIPIGILVGILTYISVSMYEDATRRFERVMGLLFGLLFLLEVGLYFLLSPRFTAAYAFYWVILIMSGTLVFMSIFAEEANENRRFKYVPFTINPKKGLTLASSLKHISRSSEREES